MSEVHAKPVVDGFLWFVEEDGKKIATLQLYENNKFLLCNKDTRMWFNKKEEIVNTFGDKFFLPPELRIVPTLNTQECYGYPSDVRPHNVMYDVK